jgi:hypothetical protein
VISIEQEYKILGNNGELLTRFDEIYKIKIHRLNIRELIMMKSLLFTESNQEIIKVVRLQPNQNFFYKTCLELDCLNLVSLLSFDTQPMKYLLNEQFSEYFSKMYPLIYKNKYTKQNKKGYYYTNPIN